MATLSVSTPSRNNREVVSPPPTTLLSLPNELLLEIAQHLPRLSDLNSLLLGNQRLRYLLTPHLIKRAVAPVPIGGRSSSVLHWAAAHGDTALLQTLLSYIHRKKLLGKSNPINDRDRDGRTPLYAATMNNDIASVELLLQHGADVRGSGIRGNPLFYAVPMGNHEMIQLLLNAGANPRAAGPDGFTVLHVAAVNDDYITIKMLLEAGASAKDCHGLIMMPGDYLYQPAVGTEESNLLHLYFIKMKKIAVSSVAILKAGLEKMNVCRHDGCARCIRLGRKL